MTQTLLYVEIDLIGVFILTLVFFVRKHTGVQAQDQLLFDYILTFLAAVLVLDATIWALNGITNSFAYALNLLCSVLYNIIEPFLGLFWLTYCKYSTCKDFEVLRRRFRLYLIPVVINGILSVGSLYYSWIFYVNENNVYTRGKLFFVNAAVNFLYLLASAYLGLRAARKEKNSTRRREYYYLALFLIPPLVGGILQVAVYGVSLIWICTVISLLMVYLNVQSHTISMDALTGTNNRWQLNRYLEQKIESVSSGMQLYAMMVDMDHFKEINDTYGHASGDEALVKAAAILKSSCAGSHDFLARLGGDEFVLLCERENDAEAENHRQSILERFTSFNETGKLPYRLEPSIGIARLKEGMDADMLLSAADDKMYEVKSQHHAKAF